MRGQPMPSVGAKERHGLFQHGPRADDDASAAHYNLRRGDTTEERCICRASANMRREPTRHVSTSLSGLSASGWSAAFLKSATSLISWLCSPSFVTYERTRSRSPFDECPLLEGPIGQRARRAAGDSPPQNSEHSRTER
mmetsp:Transcript_20391/g.70545  ORF Transcript_20391/g.70545 Transcript_20391/m.70545 type:complete len:139 (+) Transcript_20391:193-609(+)